MNAHDEILLIAEFMGYDTSRIVSELPVDDRGYYTDENGKWIYAASLQYKHSWDHLMKVVEKIESLGHGVTIYRNGCHINDVKLFSVIGDNGFNHKSKIEQTYRAVVEFIKWFNKSELI